MLIMGHSNLPRFNFSTYLCKLETYWSTFHFCIWFDYLQRWWNPGCIWLSRLSLNDEHRWLTKRSRSRRDEVHIRLQRKENNEIISSWVHPFSKLQYFVLIALGVSIISWWSTYAWFYIFIPMFVYTVQHFWKLSVPLT